MPTWAETKQAAQVTAGNLYSDIQNDIGGTYQQFLTGTTSRDFNNDLAIGVYEPSAEDWQEYGQYSLEQEANAQKPNAQDWQSWGYSDRDQQEPDIEP